MKINADYREFKDINDIENDMIDTIATWQNERIHGALESLSLYINDWYHDYELTAEEFEEIAAVVKDYFEDDSYLEWYDDNEQGETCR